LASRRSRTRARRRSPARLTSFPARPSTSTRPGGIHYLLTGTAGEGEEPLNFLVAGGTPVGDVDVGYGPARAFNATETARIASAMSAIDEATMRARFDGAEMTRLEIYPEIWDRPGDEEDVAGYCIENFDTLKAFIADTAARSAGMVVFLC
jgi:hypothetical protein